jgi:type IV pilus assembly protein PilB
MNTGPVLRDIPLDYELLKKFPPDFLVKHRFFPLSLEGGVLSVAINDPDDIERISIIENFCQKQVHPVAADNEELEYFLKKSDTFTKVLTDNTENFVSKHGDAGIEAQSITLDTLTEEDDTIIKLLNNIVFTAVSKKASDIHLESQAHALVVKFRIDGILSQIMEPLDLAFQSPLLTRLKVIAELDIAERRVPQDGRFRMMLNRKTIDFRVSIMPAIHGENAVIRILDREMITESFGELNLRLLGFSEILQARIREYIEYPYGMFLVTGPTGSGKTTTLYAALNEIKRPSDKIITIEDPVEYQIEGITQIPVNEKKGLTFARGLRSILRHDPDKIMVGEIRDNETAQIAIQSALTGHLVFTTVHANNVFDVLGRFIHMQVDSYSFISALNCIVAQRLVRSLCPRCKEESRLTVEECERNYIRADEMGERIFRPKGCNECNHLGYSGRSAIGEILELSDEIKEMILDKKPTSEIKKRAIEGGMTTIRRDGLMKVNAGITSLEELNRVTVREWI